MSDTLILTPAVLRALGEGVSRLNDGDMSDGEAADTVVETMRGLGYRKSGYDFVKVERFLITCVGMDQGTSETEEGVRTLLETLPPTWLGGVKVWDHDESTWREDLAR